MACTPASNPTVTFAASGVTTLTLPAPEFNDHEGHDLRLILHRDRAGQAYAYKRGARIAKYPLEFRKINKDTIALVRTFLTNSTGLLITYTDYYSTAITGYITSSDISVVAREKGYQWSIVFETP